MLSNPRTFLSILGLLVLACARSASAGDSSSVNYLDRGSARMLASPDTQFALQAAQESLAAVKLGKLAAAKAADPTLRSFSEDMAAESAKTTEQLKDIARAERMTLPDVSSPRGQDLFVRLTRSPGTAFDKSYVSHILKALRRRAKVFAKEAAKGEDPLLANFAARKLPVLQHDLLQLKSLQSKVARLNRN